MLENIVVTDIKEVYTVFSPKGRCETIVERKTYGLSFCTEGKITYTHNGKTAISDKNHAVILPQGQTYDLRNDKGGSFPLINFTCNEKITDTVISIPIQNLSEYINNFEKLKSLSYIGSNRSEMLSVFYHMIYCLFEQKSVPKTILPAVKYMENNYKNPDLTNEEMARICNISEVHFRHLFAKQFGIPPKQYITEIRINKAKQLLSEGVLKIYAVASECGFSSQYHFCRIFKSKTGLTPTEYMLRNRIYKI